VLYEVGGGERLGIGWACEGWGAQELRRKIARVPGKNKIQGGESLKKGGLLIAIKN